MKLAWHCRHQVQVVGGKLAKDMPACLQHWPKLVPCLVDSTRAAELSAAEREAYEQQLREKEAAAAAEVARKEAELRAVQDEASAHVAEADAKLGELVEQVGWAAAPAASDGPYAGMFF